EHVEFRAGGNLGGLATGYKRGRVVVLAHRGGDGVFLVVVLDLAVVDVGRAVVDHRQARRAQGLTFTALFERADGGAQILSVQYIRERFLDPYTQGRNILAVDKTGEILRVASGLHGTAGFPEDTQLQKRRLGD